MLKLFGLVMVLTVGAAMPALAQECGTAPFAPAIPAPADIDSKTVEAARAQVVDAYHQVKAYQAALKPYRSCLDMQTAKAKTAMVAAQQKKDTVQAASMADEIDQTKKAYDSTIDSETQVAKDFNTLHIAQCTRDTDPNVCPKKQ